MNKSYAKIYIDEDLGEGSFCDVCMNWIESYEISAGENCINCEEKNTVTKRKKKISGWIGLQRFLHEKNYGLHLIRNNRVIEQYNKDISVLLKEINDFLFSLSFD